ncbi:MAG: protein kinase [Mastigocoleus sp.]
MANAKFPISEIMSLCINPLCSQPLNSDNILFCGGCGSELLLQGRYKVVKFLGGGGFGKTYEIKERDTNLKVLKILHNNHPKAIELFHREASVLSILNCPGIPLVEADGYFIYYPRNSPEALHCLVMEKIEGMDLYAYIKQRGYQPIDEKMALQWLKEITVILQQVHNQNFFHRDIKPANIMLRADGGLALIDFGTARVVTDTYWEAQAQGQVTGIISAGYTPPEQMNGQAMQQSDFFALGRTFVYLLTAKDPNQFYNPQRDELLWRDEVPNISSEFADFLDQMMARSPMQRPENTENILQRLSQIKPISSLPSKSLESRNINSKTVDPSQVGKGINSSSNPGSISNSKISFFYQWMLSNIVGIGLGLFLRNIFSGVVYSIFRGEIGFYYACLAAIITWFPVEILRWLALKREINVTSWSLIETLFGFGAGLFLGALTGRVLLGSGGQLVGAFLGIMSATSLTQWLTIHRQMRNIWGWLTLSVMGIAVSLILGPASAAIAYFILNRIWNGGGVLTVSFSLGVMISTVLSSFITGIGLWRLFRRRIN